MLGSKVESRVGFLSSPDFYGIITWLNFAENDTGTMITGNGTVLLKDIWKGRIL